MTTDTASTETTRDLGTAVGDATDTVARTLGDAAGTVRDLASTTADRFPEAASTARELLVEADRQMRGGSDEMLAAGATLSSGIAVGLLVAGANRALVALAIVPAIAMGLTLLDRSTVRTGRGRAKA